jgi:hypothetical protein
LGHEEDNDWTQAEVPEKKEMKQCCQKQPHLVGQGMTRIRRLTQSYKSFKDNAIIKRQSEAVDQMASDIPN